MELEVIMNMFFGFSMADALGVPVEFLSREDINSNPVKSMRGFGTHNQPPGTWSDDSSLTFCLAESLVNGYNLKDIATNFVDWKNGNLWTPRGYVFDIGIQTRSSISKLSEILQKKDYETLESLKYEVNERTNGNGSLMRILPLVFYIKGKMVDEQFDIIWNVSALTHGHIRAGISCFIYLKFAEFILDGDSIEISYLKMRRVIHDFFISQEISEKEIHHFDRLIKNDISELKEEEIASSGYVIHTLEASFWCLLNSNSYLESVFKAINLGEDTDTTATVVGGIAGYYYSIDEVPDEWYKTIARREDIIELCQRFAKTYLK